MKLHVFGSGSSGNCYIIETSNSALLLECGVGYKYIVRSNVLDKVEFGVVSHCHSDHAKYLDFFLSRGFKILNNIVTHHNSIEISHRKKIVCSDWKIIPLKMIHDVECYGFLINHEECGNILFVTDTSEIPYNLYGINHFIIESNFSQDILDNKQLNHKIHHSLATRIENAHLSYEKCCDFLEKTDKSSMQSIVLCHLSDTNSTEDLFVKGLKEKFGIPIYSANKGDILSLNF